MCVVHAYACVCVHAYAYSVHVCIFENVMV
jgi:hypothetical protein